MPAFALSSFWLFVVVFHVTASAPPHAPVKEESCALTVRFFMAAGDAAFFVRVTFAPFTSAAVVTLLRLTEALPARSRVNGGCF